MNVPQTARRWLLALALTCPFAEWASAQSASTSEDDEIFELSPFEVKSSADDTGYRATNTLAGSRLSTNLADIGASISVVTLQQMEDTASTDLNDIFRYEASTEGSSTYTPGVGVLRGDGIADVNAGFASGANGIAMTNATANTVRGLGSPSASINFYRAINQIPLDSYNVQSVEISRGPNSMLFGTGSPAGVVNQSRTTAALNQNLQALKLKFDDRGSKRASLSFNRSLVDDKLAVAGAILVDNKEFERKPSYDDTRRFYGSVTFKPTEKTKFNLNFEDYSNENRRPNTLTPVDYVTPWIEEGMPMYNPITKMVTYTSTGEQVGPFINRTGSPLIDDVRSYIMGLPDYDETKWNSSQTSYNGRSIVGWTALAENGSALQVPSMRWTNSRPTMQIGGGETVNWFQAQPGGYRTQFGTDENPAANAPWGPSSSDIYANADNYPVYEQYWSSSADYSARGGDIASWKYSGVTDQSIYDWENLNILQMNYGEEDARTTNLEFEQKLNDDLYFSAGWFRQDFESYSSYTVSQLNATTFYVDTNSHLPDGSVNPYAGGVYVQDLDPDSFRNELVNDQYRAILAYTPDFTANDGWSRWLGKHQFIGFLSEEKETQDFYRLRFNYYDSGEADAGMIRYLANPNNDADGNPTGYRNEGATTRRAFYLSQPNLDVSQYGVANMGSGEWNYTDYTGNMDVYNWENSQWQQVSYSASFNPHSAHTGSKQTKISTWNIGGTSHFWEDRIVATYGIREDEVSNRGTTSGTITDENGNVLSESLTRPELYENGFLNLDAIMDRYRPWTTISEQTSTAGVVVRPFKGWDGIESRANSGNLFSEFLNTVGFTFNKSETFNPPTSARVDLFGNALPKPSGEGEDIGIQFSLFENKLFAKVSKYESSNENEQISGGTVFSRFTGNLDQSTFRNWARTIALINWGQDPTNTETFGANLSTAQEEQLEADIEAIWGLPYDYYSDLGSTGATRSVFAEGTEVEVVYNPTRNWTLKFTGSKQETVYSNVMKEYGAWFDRRFPDWQNASAADHLLPEYQDLATYTTDGGTNVNLTNFWSSYGYTSQVRDTNPVDRTVEAYYNSILVPQVRLATDLEGQVITNQSKYQAALTTNYKFTDGKYKGWSVGGSMRWLDKKSIGYYGKASGANGPDYIDISDTSRPIYTPAQTFYDFWLSHKRPIWDGKADMKVQLNIVNAFESGGLQTVGVNFDGSPYGYRIIDPRKFVLSFGFDM
ncbi:TonB-dependent receptor plug domain-containing protein [Pelagicoccus sp. NFK12]|uniref:TonB-dependent receptor plug domain-containing protein n=1 Tax=Pelagicoccus enzymogenes TaxID=2773457 RepID=A0A927F4L3_9BACT|nr:TonB-dependent receptor plug domain-containing protein [Pelagicoccus enzymogenes]MBD5778299.1 TonB-dependent receptor plug domain-containing protein [Pelagicoccus enzymogenes]